MLAWRPASRALPVLTISAAIVLATVPSIVARLTGSDDLTGAVTAAAVLGGAAVGFFVEDPAGDTLAASPTPLGRRRCLRLAAISAGVVGMTSLVLALAATAQPVAELRLTDRLAELVAGAALAAAIAGVGHRRGIASAGPTGAVGGAMLLLVISSLAYRIRGLPTVAGLEHHDRWWLIALAGAAVATWSSRDPCRS